MLLNLPGLTQIIDSADYAAYVFNIHEINFTAPVPTLRLSLVDIEGSGRQVDFSLAISDLTSFALREYFWLAAHDLTDSHPLLLPYQEPHSSLYIKGHTEHLKELSFDLLQIYLATYGKWQPFPSELFAQLQLGHALLANGPEPLIQRYAAKVGEYGIHTSIIPSYTPAPSNLKVLTLDDNYFVGSRFEFTVRHESE
ncbi:hypothetical protein [Hymenobacter norwichensis]|uniref:hypothetical protein n=1 Tax=Hymenobacter norwichensis TaxID=223903 RepID=UPI0003B40A42|nr:hypothetical protein [Hymenobacter norwichensis]